MKPEIIREYINDLTAIGGSPVYIAIAIIGFFLNPVFFFQLVLGYILSYVFVFPFRIIYFRERPEKRQYILATEGSFSHERLFYKKRFLNWLYRIDASSFPSHHTVRATILWLLVANYFNHLPAYILAVAAIAAVAYTRFSLKRHHKSDVIAGVILGAVAFLVILFLTPMISEIAGTVMIA